MGKVADKFVASGLERPLTCSLRSYFILTTMGAKRIRFIVYANNRNLPVFIT